MPAAVRLADRCSGHGCWPPRENVAASGNVFVNSRGAHRVGDGWSIHCCRSCHAGSMASGSPNVYVNGKQLARIGDNVSCGSKAATGSINVFANG